MAVNLKAPKRLVAIKGITLGTTNAGLKKRNRDDLAVISVAPGSAVAGVFTMNRFAAAPIEICRKHLRSIPDIRALVINSGIANAGTGTRGLANALETCALTAGLVGCRRNQVLPFSTGVIIEQLPVERFGQALVRCVSGLAKDNWLPAARAIMTTDTLEKGVSRTVDISDGKATVTGIAKGSGMIHPDMATMLAYIATDANLPQRQLEQMQGKIAGATFNTISVDSDTSTNDSFVTMATGASFGRPTPSVSDRKRIAQAIEDVAEHLALSIVRDGEGATKLITVNVSGMDFNSCRSVACSITTSPLVKTAFFANDANIGRIVMAIGKSGATFRKSDVSVRINGLPMISGGEVAPRYDEKRVTREMRKSEVVLDVSIGKQRGQTARMRTCDFSSEYIHINSKYRS